MRAFSAAAFSSALGPHEIKVTKAATVTRDKIFFILMFVFFEIWKRKNSLYFKTSKK
jgi:hypothetical protein